MGSFTKRENEFILTRLRVGHTRLTRTYLILGRKSPERSRCNVPLRIHHVLTSYCYFKVLYKTYFNSSSPILNKLVGSLPHSSAFHFHRVCSHLYLSAKLIGTPPPSKNN